MRPNDEETGKALPPAHIRLRGTAEPWIGAAVLAVKDDARLCHLTLKRKITLAERALNHVVDGDKQPAWSSKTDRSLPGNHALTDAFRRMCRAIEAERAKA